MRQQLDNYFKFPGLPSNLQPQVQHVQQAYMSPATTVPFLFTDTNLSAAGIVLPIGGRTAINCITSAGSVANGRDACVVHNLFNLANPGDTLLFTGGYYNSHVGGDLSFGFGVYGATMNFTETANRVTMRKLAAEARPSIRIRDASNTEAHPLNAFPDLAAATWYDFVLMVRRTDSASIGEVTFAQSLGGAFNQSVKWDVQTFLTDALPGGVSIAPCYGWRGGSTSARTGAFSHLGYAFCKA